MDIQYKPTKPKKEKPVKVPKAPKAEKAMKFNSSVQAVKTTKPKKEKPVTAPKPEKAMTLSFGKPKAQTDKPVKVENANKKPGIFSKIDPKWILGGAVVLIAAIAVVVLTVVLPAVEEHGEQIQYIAISSTPNKMEYIVGENADYTGLRVLVKKNNGETTTIRSGKCQITGFDSSVADSQQTITVSYEGFTTTFDIVINEKPRPISVLESITLEKMPKTEYRVGEWLDTNGGVLVLHYKDGSTYKVSLLNSYIYGFEKVKGAGTYELTVKYSENGKIAETTYTITVTE